MKRIILTGGGTAGHVTPNIALVPKLKEKGYDIQYIGSYDGIERKLIEDLTGDMCRIFAESFVIINNNFKSIFTELFGGGKAELVLTDPEKEVYRCKYCEEKYDGRRK